MNLEPSRTRISGTFNRSRFQDILNKLDEKFVDRIPIRFSPDAVFSEDEDDTESSANSDSSKSSIYSESDITGIYRSFSEPENLHSSLDTSERFVEDSDTVKRNILLVIPKTNQLSIAPFKQQLVPRNPLSTAVTSEVIVHEKQSVHTNVFPGAKPKYVTLSNLTGFSQTSVTNKNEQPKKNISPKLENIPKKLVTKHSDVKKFCDLPHHVAAPPIFPTSDLNDNIIIINHVCYDILSFLGSGQSCKVYAALNKETKVIVAIKRVNLEKADESMKEGFRMEIKYLQILCNSQHVIKLIDYEYTGNELLIVLEKGEIDLLHYLTNAKARESLTDITIKFFWSEMLKAVSEIHKYGIIHSDLKPANFLIVAGRLKLIDFGISSTVPEDMTSVIRKTQIGTVNYMSPETVTNYSSPGKHSNEELQFKLGVKSDVWSLGCILYNFTYGSTPFQHFRSIVQKIQAITSPQYEISYPPVNDKYRVDVLKLCLERDIKKRASVDQLLNHPYLTGEPPVKVDDHLKEILESLKSFTPRRISVVSKVVRKLAKEDKQ